MRYKATLLIMLLMVSLASIIITSPIHASTIPRLTDKMVETLVNKLYDPNVGLFRETWGTVEGQRWYWNTEQGEALQMIVNLPQYSDIVDNVLKNYEEKLQYKGLAFTRYVTNATAVVAKSDPGDFYIRNYIIGVGGDLTGDTLISIHEDIYDPSLWLVGYFHSHEVWYNGTWRDRWDPYTTGYGIIEKAAYVEAYKTMSDGNLTYTLTFRVLDNTPYIEVWGNVTNNSPYYLSDVQVTVALDFGDRFHYKYLYIPGYGIIEAKGDEQWPVQIANNSNWKAYHFILYSKRPIGVNKAVAVIMDSWKNSTELWVFNTQGADGETYYMWFKIRIHMFDFNPGETKTFRLRVVPMQSFDPLHLSLYDEILSDIDSFLHHDLTYAVNTGTGPFKGLAMSGIIGAAGDTPLSISLWNRFYETFKGWSWNVATRPLANFILSSLILYERTMNKTYLNVAEEAANKLLSLQVRDPSDYRYGGFLDMPMIGVGTYLDVNAEAAHALFKLYEVTGNRTYYDAAMFTLNWIRQDENGEYYYHRFNNETRYYMFDKEPFAHGYFLQAFAKYMWSDSRTLTSLNRIFMLMNFDEYWVKTWDKANETNVETQSSTALGILTWQRAAFSACNGFTIDYVKNANITSIVPMVGGIRVELSNQAELAVITPGGKVIVKYNNVELKKALSILQLSPGRYVVYGSYIAVSTPGPGAITITKGESYKPILDETTTTTISDGKIEFNKQLLIIPIIMMVLALVLLLFLRRR